MKHARTPSIAIGALSVALAAGACGGHARTQNTASTSSTSVAPNRTVARAANRPVVAPARLLRPTGPASCDQQTSSAVTVHLPSGSVRLDSRVLAMVGHQAITAAQCQAQLTSELAGSIPLGTPPDYSACVLGLRAEQAREQKALAKVRKGAPKLPTQSTAALRRECAERVTSIVQSALSQLIQTAWTTQQAAAEHITVTGSQVQAALAAQRKAFRSTKLYDQYLARLGLSQAQLAARERTSLLEEQVYQRRLGAAVTVTNQQVAAFFHAHRAEFVLPHHPAPKLSTYAARIRLLLEAQARSRTAAGAEEAFTNHWKSITACRPAYAIALCANAPKP
jgi:hypothetical protein